MTRIFGCWIPTAMADDPPMWRAFWEHEVRARGHEPVGEPTITEVPDLLLRSQSRWIAKGPTQAADQTDSTAARSDSSGTAV